LDEKCIDLGKPQEKKACFAHTAYNMLSLTSGDKMSTFSTQLFAAKASHIFLVFNTSKGLDHEQGLYHA
jgi:hypothetical protein